MSNPTNAEAEKPLAYRVKPFCQRVGISPATFYKYVGLKKIRSSRSAGGRLFRRESGAFALGGAK